jgi:hypothetical protein
VGGTLTDPCAETTGEFPTGGGYYCGANLPLSICTSPDPATGNITCQTPPTDRLYLCSNSATVGYVTCADGCHASEAGVPDYCLDADPCASSSLNGDICGSSLTPLADPNTLYTCQDQVTLVTAACSAGCIPAPVGQADQCALEHGLP